MVSKPLSNVELVTIVFAKSANMRLQDKRLSLKQTHLTIDDI